MLASWCHVSLSLSISRAALTTEKWHFSFSRGIILRRGMFSLCAIELHRNECTGIFLLRVTPSFTQHKTMEAAARTPTLGMRLDNAIDKLDSLSSTQLYAIIVAIAVIVCWTLLATTANQPEIPELTSTATRPASPKKREGPEPRWHFMQWANIVAVVTFVWSVVHFALNATTYWNMDTNVLLKFLILWGTLLCYFFGFFGVTFVHDLEDVETSETEAVVQKNAR